jgi:hypothetical protein
MRGVVVALPTATPLWTRCAATYTLSTNTLQRTRRARSHPRDFPGDTRQQGGRRMLASEAAVWSPAVLHRPKWPEDDSLSSHVLGCNCWEASWWRGDAEQFWWTRHGELGTASCDAMWGGCCIGKVEFGGGWPSGQRCNTSCYSYSNYLIISFIRNLIMHQMSWLIKF